MGVVYFLLGVVVLVWAVVRLWTWVSDECGGNDEYGIHAFFTPSAESFDVLMRYMVDSGFSRIGMANIIREDVAKINHYVSCVLPFRDFADSDGCRNTLDGNIIACICEDCTYNEIMSALGESDFHNLDVPDFLQHVLRVMSRYRNKPLCGLSY